MEPMNLRIGEKLKSIRMARTLSLDDTAALTGVSKPMLGQIERGQSVPTVTTLWKIATGLKTPLSAFLEEPQTEYTVTGPDEANVVLGDGGKMRAYPLFTYDPVRSVETFYIEFDPECRHSSDKHDEGVEEHIFVLRGTLRLVLGEEVPHTGTLFRASGLKISYVPQRADHLRGDPVTWAEKQGIDLTRFLTILRKLDFSRELFQRDMAGYSAGQQKKVLLAASLCQSAHLYLWDEPLNYIDLFSRIQLEELLLQYRPTLLFVEHDQIFRKKIATEVLSM